jgi:RNA polymerase sigma factor (sigma-70 family)
MLVEDLIQKVQQLPVNSAEYRKALNKLLILISEQLIRRHPLQSEDRTNWYDDVIADAIVETIEAIPKKIQEYDSTRGIVMAWAFNIFRGKLSNLKRKHQKKQLDSIDKMKDDSGFEPPANENNENNEIYTSFNEFIENSPQKLREKIMQCVEQDSDDLLKDIVIKSKNGNQINLQELLLMRLKDKSLTDISAESGISIKTLSSSIKRHIRQLKDYITKHTGIEFDE